MITAIRLRNFKAFKDEVEIPLSPITLLYGPNSSGKSSVLHAMLYLYEILKNDTCDVDTSSFSSEIDLGGFWNVLHRNSEVAEFSIGLSYSLSEDLGCEDMTTGYGSLDIEELEKFSELNNLGMVSPIGEYGVNYWDLYFTVAWSSEHERPYVSNLQISVADQPFGKYYPFYTGQTEGLLSIRAEPNLKNTYICDINFDHYLLTSARNEGDDIELTMQLQRLGSVEVGTTNDDKYTIPVESGKIGAKPSLGKPLNLLIGKEYLEKLHEEYYEINTKRLEGEGDIDKLKKRLSLISSRIAHTEKVLRLLQEFFSQAIVGILDNTTAALHNMVTIGPIRDIPSRQFSSPRNPDKKRWYTGLAAWDAVKRCSDEDFEKISRWMFRLKTGYSLSRRKQDSDNYPLDPVRGRQKLPGINPIEDYHVLITDTAGNEYHVQDLGTGISQIFPIVVAACLRDVGLIAIEQPELHIHPRLQVELGDLFAETIPKIPGSDGALPDDENSYLIETHSEHILLRLLRRIRETSYGNISDKSRQLTPEYVSVIYIENKRGMATVQRLRIDEEGEFIDRWPEGFFRERSDELF